MMGLNDEYAGCVVFDLETVAAPECADLLDPVKAPANYKDPLKIALYQDEKRAELISKAALEPDLCEIVAIGCWDGDHVIAQTRAEMDEADLVELAWQTIGISPIIGFNILGFDLPVLIRRTQLLGLRARTLSLDRYRTPHIDLLERLSFNGRLTYRSLAFYTRRFGIDVPDPFTGADIAKMVADHAWAGIRAHVMADIEKTFLLAQRLGYLTQTVGAF